MNRATKINVAFVASHLSRLQRGSSGFGSLFSNVQNDKVSDTTDDEQRFEVDYILIKINSPLGG